MAENFSHTPQEKREEKRMLDYSRVERLKETLMKLERSVIDQADENTLMARGAISAMGFGISPVAQPTNDSDEQLETAA